MFELSVSPESVLVPGLGGENKTLLGAKDLLPNAKLKAYQVNLSSGVQGSILGPLVGSRDKAPDALRS